MFQWVQPKTLEVLRGKFRFNAFPTRREPLKILNTVVLVRTRRNVVVPSGWLPQWTPACLKNVLHGIWVVTQKSHPDSVKFWVSTTTKNLSSEGERCRARHTNRLFCSGKPVASKLYSMFQRLHPRPRGGFADISRERARQEPQMIMEYRGLK